MSQIKGKKILIFSGDKYTVNALAQVYRKLHTAEFGHSWLSLIKIKWLLQHLRVFQGRTGFASSVWCRTEKREASGQDWMKSAELRRITGRFCDMAGGAVSVKYGGRAGWEPGGLQDRTIYIFLLYKLFYEDTGSSIVPSLAQTTKLANLQCVPEPTHHSSPQDCIPGKWVSG